MDPISALGVAAAALQFLDASVKAYGTFRQIRGNAASATEHNAQLEENLREAQKARAQLTLKPQAQKSAEDPLSKAAARCLSRADEILKLLEYVRGGGMEVSSLRIWWRVMRKQNAIRKLYNLLKEDQGMLNQLISEELLPAIHGLDVQQGEAFANLNSLAQGLVRGAMEQKEAVERQHIVVVDKIDDMERTKRHGEFLESLRFPGIDERQESIKAPAPRTLEWLFGPPVSSVSNSGRMGHPNGAPPDLRQWLREDSSLYWISGKAGSGKSTLMAHVAQDSRTQKELEVWSRGCKLHILSFYFWRAGTPDQKSVRGLLRTLLYRLCSLEPDILDRISQDSPGSGQAMVWTEGVLLSAITQAIGAVAQRYFCIFIDGLDEYEGNYHEVAKCVDQLRNLPNVKVCVSSRPELEFSIAFSRAKTIQLQDLNYDDILVFAENTLQAWGIEDSHRVSYKSLSKRIALDAEGVFLWAALVTQELGKAYQTGEDLQKCLSALPRRLDTLFAQMLSKLSEADLKWLSFSIQVMEAWNKMEIPNVTRNRNGLPVSLMATLRLAATSREVNSYDEFSDFCERTKSYIRTSTAGLLEIGVSRDRRISRHLEWERTSNKYINDRPRFRPTPEGIGHRRRAPDSLLRPAMMDYEEQHVKWIHRSARDYLSADQSPLKAAFSPPNDLIRRRLMDAHVSYAISAPSLVRHSIERLTTLITLANLLEDDNNDKFSTSSGALHEVYDFYTNCPDVERGSDHPINCSSVDGKEFNPSVAFWSACIKIGHIPDLNARLDRFSQDMGFSHDTGSSQDMDSGTFLADKLIWAIWAIRQLHYQNTGSLLGPSSDEGIRFVCSLADQLRESITKGYPSVS